MSRHKFYPLKIHFQRILKRVSGLILLKILQVVSKELKFYILNN